MVGLTAYSERIGCPGLKASNPAPDLQLLREIVLAHTCSIAFENLNALMRAPVSLDIAALEAKLIRDRRGGYCFEQNALLAAALERIGYSVERLAARVVWGGSAAQPWHNPRTHMVLLVSIGGERYLCDVGFGGNTPTAPLLFGSEEEQSTPHEPFRIVSHRELNLLQVRLATQWHDVYLFDLQPQTAADYEMANHYVATHPASHFRFTLMAARASAHARFHLKNRTLTTFPGGGRKEQRLLRDGDETVQVLRSIFGIELPDESSLRAALGNIRE